LEEIRSTIFGVEPGVLEGVFKGVLHRHFPFGYYMKFIAERFGALRRGLMFSGDSLKELALRFRITPIYDETIREALLLHVDFPRVPVTPMILFDLQYLKNNVTSFSIGTPFFLAIDLFQKSQLHYKNPDDQLPNHPQIKSYP